MSKRKDRERFLLKKEANISYVGFRGTSSSPSHEQASALETAVCIRCGRKRNVPASTVTDHPNDYVCATCKDS